MRLFAISDIHVGRPENLKGMQRMQPHPDDWLALAGDIGDSEEELAIALEALRGKFAQLLWVPGNHDLWVRDDLHDLRGVERYERLVRLSGGNVRQALRLWLAAAHLDPDVPGLVVVGPLPGHATPLIEELPLSSRVLLAALLLHGPLRRADLVDLHGAHALDLDDELARLAHLGLVIFEHVGRTDVRVIGVDTRSTTPRSASHSQAVFRCQG